VREGYRLIHGLDAQPKPKELAALGTIFAPYRSTAAWYLWRSLEFPKEESTTEARRHGERQKPKGRSAKAS
jgi:3-methyladenine DNA glycosylase/8-oxoguanine DNA glycosylase